MGFQPNPITTQEITAWLDIHQIIDPEVRLEVYEVVRAVDHAHLKHHHEKQDKDAAFDRARQPKVTVPK